MRKRQDPIHNKSRMPKIDAAANIASLGKQRRFSAGEGRQEEGAHDLAAGKRKAAPQQRVPCKAQPTSSARQVQLATAIAPKSHGQLTQIHQPKQNQQGAITKMTKLILNFD